MQDSFFNQPIAELDPQIAEVLNLELNRQRDTLEMIASENFVPRAVLQAQGSVLTNKYAEGYPGRRYYGGCEYVDIAENLARDRAKAVFGAGYANVQPHSGAQANAAIYHALLQTGDTVMGLELAHGGHLTHGMKLNFSGKNFNIVSYGVSPEDNLIHMDEVRAYLWIDMAHFAGLVAAGLHPNPVNYADVVTTTIHKTIGGPRSGMILAKDFEPLGKKLNSAVFPGQQGGPLMHVIAAKAVALKIAGTEEFKDRQRRTLEGAKIIADRLMQPDVKEAGVSVLTGGTDVHLVLVDLRESQMDGQQAEDLLHNTGITVNRNAVPFDPRPPAVTSGLRIGTPALATRGFGAEEFEEVADIIAQALRDGATADVQALSERVDRLTQSFPLYQGLDQIHFAG